MQFHYIYQGTLSFRPDADGAVLEWIIRTEKGDAVMILLEGDILTVWDERGKELFHDTLRPNHLRDWRPFPQQRSLIRSWLAGRWDTCSPAWRDSLRAFLRGSPFVDGAWVLWTQPGEESERWVRLFMQNGEPTNHAARLLRPADPVGGHISFSRA